MELQRAKSDALEVHNVLNKHDSKDRAQAVGSLPIMSADHATNDTMLMLFQRSPESIRFLQLTGGYWPGSDEKNALNHQKISFVLIRLIMVAFVGINLYLLAWSILNQSAPTIVGFSTNLVGLFSVTPAQYLNQCRLKNSAHFQDSALLDESRKVAVQYGTACIVMLIISLVFLCLGGGAIGVLIVASQFAILIYLTFNLLFLVLDLKASSLLLDQLHILADNKLLDMHKFKVVRSDIHRRVEASRGTSDLIMGPCIAAVLLITVMVFVLEHSASADGLLYLFGILCIAAKEVLFVAIVFRNCAKVNGKADELTTKLSKDMYCADPEDYKQLLPDIQRVSVHASSISEPITFPLLFKRVSWQNVMVSAAGFATTIIVGLIKTVVTAQL